MQPFFVVVLVVLAGSQVLRLFAANRIEQRLKTLRREGRGLSVPNLFSPWEQLQAFWWVLSGEFRFLADKQTSRWGNIARVGAFGSLVGLGGVILGLVLLSTGIIPPQPM